MGLKEKLESHPLIFFLSTLTVGFLAGLGTYKFVLDVAKLDTVRSGTYVLRTEIDDLKAKSAALTEQTGRKCADEVTRLSQELERLKTERITTQGHSDAERRALVERVSKAERGLAAANALQCPEPVLDAHYVGYHSAIGDVAYCVAKASEIASTRGANPKTVGGYEVQFFLRDGQARFYCSIACFSNSTSIICNGPNRLASRGWADALWQEISRK